MIRSLLVALLAVFCEACSPPCGDFGCGPPGPFPPDPGAFDAGTPCDAAWKRRCAGDEVWVCQPDRTERLLESCLESETCTDGYCLSACPGGCPNGTSCDGTRCVGDAGAELVIDVRTVTFDVRVQVDGGAPPGSCDAGTSGRLVLKKKAPDAGEAGYFFIELDCDGRSGPVSNLPGTYDVSVLPAGQSFPTAEWRAQALPEDGGTLELGIQVTSADGVVLENGGLPAKGAHCSLPGAANAYTAEVIFKSSTGATFRTSIPCSTQSFAFSLPNISAGLYDVDVLLLDNAFRVAEDAPLPSVRSSRWPAATALQLPAPGPLQLNLDTARVSGRVLHNGTTPTAKGTCPTGVWERVSVRWIGDDGIAYDTPIACDDATFRFTAAVAPGVRRPYVTGLTKESALGGAALSSLPLGTWVGPPVTFVAGQPVAVDLNVESVQLTGELRVDGGTPTVSGECNATLPIADVVLDQQFAWSRRLLPVGCDFRFGPVQVMKADDYSFSLGQVRGSTNLPSSAQPLLTTAVSADQHVILDASPVPTHAVSGSVTVNGATPRLLGSCNNSSINLSFTGDAGITARVPVNCYDGTFEWTTQLPSGDWSVSFSAAAYSGFSVPLAGFPSSERYYFPELLHVDSARSAVRLDVPVRWTRASVFVDGAPAAQGPGCLVDATEVGLTFGDYSGIFRRAGTLTESCLRPEEFEGPLFGGSYDVYVLENGNKRASTTIPRNQVLVRDVVIP